MLLERSGPGARVVVDRQMLDPHAPLANCRNAGRARRLRRLVLCRADRFPDIAAAWFEDAFHRTLVLLGESLTRLAERGMLHGLGDPVLAAYQFAGLVMYKPISQVMFAGTDARPDADELAHIADRAAEVFIAAYGRPGETAR